MNDYEENNNSQERLGHRRGYARPTRNINNSAISNKPNNNNVQINTAQEQQSNNTNEELGNKKGILIGAVVGALIVGGVALMFTHSNPSDRSSKDSGSVITKTPNGGANGSGTGQQGASSGGTTSSSPAIPEPPKVKRGYITGDEVIVRESPSISAARIDELDKNTIVEILDIVRNNNAKEVILTKRRTLNYDGDKIPMEPGLALKIIRDTGSTYICEMEIDNRKISVNNIPKSDVRFVNGDAWYKVRLSSGKEGYIYGKYVREQ